jgi:Virus neck protein
MAVNFYFDQFQNQMEQELLSELVQESIRIHGIDVYYLPRETVDFDEVYTEDALHEYQRAIMVDMFLKTFDQFGGDGQFLQKFNLEIRDTVTFSIAQRTFQEEITQPVGILRPREGDLIYLPVAKRMFKITYTDKFPVLMPLGSLPSYDLKCEMFEYSGEIFNTGIREIDAIEKNFNIELNNFALSTESRLEVRDEDGFTILQESYDIDLVDPSAQNDEIEIEADSFINFSERDPFSEGTY